MFRYVPRDNPHWAGPGALGMDGRPEGLVVGMGAVFGSRLRVWVDNWGIAVLVGFREVMLVVLAVGVVGIRCGFRCRGTELVRGLGFGRVVVLAVSRVWMTYIHRHAPPGLKYGRI